MENLYCIIMLALLLICKAMPSQAQEVDTTYSHGMNVIFQHLDKSKVPYGLLQDVALEVAELKYYTGTSLIDSNRVFAENFDQIYLTLSTAQIHPSAAVDFPHPDLVDSIWFARRKPGQVTLAGLYYQYSRFADDAANKVTILNDQIYDKYVNSVWQNPYQTERVVGFAPANFNYPGLNFNLILPAELWLSNQKNSVVSMAVDAGDGLGYRNLLPNVALPVNYADSGLKVLKFRIILNDSTVLQSHSLLHITKNEQVILPLRDIPDVLYADQEEELVESPDQSESLINNNAANYNPPLFIPAYDYWFLVNSAPKRDVFRVASSETINGKRVKGYVTIDYASDDKTIKKPLIVSEGFDPGILTDPESQFGVTGIEDFKDEISNSDDLKSMMINTPQYDIIYVDWENGTDNLKANALLLKTVIRRINGMKGADGANPIEKNVVLGQSMGGVIARYALKKMELAGENHDTRLYISHDAPHQGANVPLAFQALNLHAQTIRSRAFLGTAIYHLFGGKKDKVLDMIDKAAAKQMLSNRLSLDEGLGNSYSFILNQIYFNNWQNELKNLGYPQQCRNIAISNGSECGNPYPIEPGSNLYLYDGYFKGKLLGDLVGMVALPLAGVATSQIETGLLGLIPGSNKFNLHFEMNSMADGGGNLLYKGKVVYKKKILWFIPVTYTITNMSYTAPQGFNAIDQYPGGTYLLEPANETVTDNNDFYSNKYHLFINTGFSFVPTISALDIGKGQVVLAEEDYYKPYIGANPPLAPKNTPFDNFITAFSEEGALNEEHISFTPRNGKWLKQELNLNQLQANCSMLCSLTDNSIQGPDVICGTSNYTLNGLPVGASITWEVMGSFQILGANNQAIVSVKMVGNGSGKLKAKINGVGLNCVDRLLVKTISASGAPATQNITGEYFNNGAINQENLVPVESLYPVKGLYFSVPEIQGVTYQWTVNGQTYGGSQNSDLIVYAPECGINYPTTKTFNLNLTLTNTCGSTHLCKIFYYNCLPSPNLQPGGDCIVPLQNVLPNSFNFYPNPASEAFTIAYTEEKLQEYERLGQNPPAFEVNIYNEKSMLVLNQQSREGDRELSLDTRNLPNGNYFLHIQQGKQVVKQQIIIQH